MQVKPAKSMLVCKTSLRLMFSFEINCQNIQKGDIIYLNVLHVGIPSWVDELSTNPDPQITCFCLFWRVLKVLVKKTTMRSLKETCPKWRPIKVNQLFNFERLLFPIKLKYTPVKYTINFVRPRHFKSTYHL